MPAHQDLTTTEAIHGERIAVLQRDVTDIKGTLAEMKSELRGVTLVLAEIRGGWKIGVRIAAGAGAVVGGIAALVSELILKRM